MSSNYSPAEAVDAELCSSLKRAAATTSGTRAVRVLQIGKYYPPHRGGMESHLQTLCARLKHLMDVEVIVANTERRTIEETIDGIKITRAGCMMKLAAAPVCPAMVRKIRQSQADLIHIHLPNPTAILAYLASNQRGRLVFTYHSDIVQQKYLSRGFDPVLRYALDKAEAIIASSPNLIDESSVLKTFRHRCHVIPFGIETKTFAAACATKVRRIREQFGSRLVLGVGRLVYYKGFEFLVRAMRHVDANLLIVGQGPLHEHLVNLAQSHGIGNRVTFLTDVKDVTPYYHAADVFALPSIARNEAFGIVQLEAMAAGKPVVNTHLPSGVPFVSVDKVTGLTVPPADAEALAGAINGLLDDPNRSTAYGQAGKRRVAREFDLDLMMRNTIELYEKVLR
ncbi:MAG: glycosyltransferase [Pyrinomonadaceae bacterium MAG19_C2-C3]|nr:glycosyltransferase [Pyrinomonadaceae bacterium MAG19_C2-C3]